MLLVTFVCYICFLGSYLDDDEVIREKEREREENDQLFVIKSYYYFFFVHLIERSTKLMRMMRVEFISLLVVFARNSFTLTLFFILTITVQRHSI